MQNADLLDSVMNTAVSKWH